MTREKFQQLMQAYQTAIEDATRLEMQAEEKRQKAYAVHNELINGVGAALALSERIDGAVGR